MAQIITRKSLSPDEISRLSSGKILTLVVEEHDRAEITTIDPDRIKIAVIRSESPTADHVRRMLSEAQTNGQDSQRNRNSDGNGTSTPVAVSHLACPMRPRRKPRVS